MFLLLIAAIALAKCPDKLPAEYADDEKSSGRVILVVKDTRELGVYDGDALVSKCFPITMGPAADDGPKLRRGDVRTPEGWYSVTHRNPNSAFELSLGISYPNFDDVMRGVENGTILYPEADRVSAALNAGKAPPQNTALGGDIFFHANPGRFVNDWTLGCVSLLSADMRELYRLGDPGAAVLILPTLGKTQSAELVPTAG